MSDPKYENWELSGPFDVKNVMTGWAGRKSYALLKKFADSSGMIETLHTVTQRGLVHFTFREPKDVKTPNPSHCKTEAKRHHQIHGDMDGNVCLLNKCALHNPEAKEKTSR